MKQGAQCCFYVSQADISMSQTQLSSNVKGITYKLEKQIGEGTFGSVFTAIDVVSQAKYAIKVMKKEPDENGLRTCTIREIACLKALSHTNIISLKDVGFTSKGCFYVMELCSFDLFNYICSISCAGESLPFDVISSFAFQILSALTFCHMHRIMHRDLKPSNCLILLDNDSNATIKLADFGMSRVFKHAGCGSDYTPGEIVTLNYRAPEVILGGDYDAKIDVWSAGCIIVELHNLRSMIGSATEFESLLTIFRYFGSPTDETWPGVSLLPVSPHLPVQFANIQPGTARLFLKQDVDPRMKSLALSMLQMDPSKRISAHAAEECARRML